MRISYFYNEDWESEYVRVRFPGHEFTFIKGMLQEHPEVADAQTEVLCVAANSQVGENELSRFPGMRFLATRSTGYDHIDLNACKARGIIVSNVPAYGQNTVAEFSMALLLALSRRVYDAYKRVEILGSFALEGLRGFDLKGKTIGIVGTGHIGLHMITMVKAFGMNVIAYDPFPKEEIAQSSGFRYVSFDELLRQSDVISLHAPYNEHTRHLINLGNVEHIKRGCFLINTARGGLVETAALVKALEGGIIAGAGLDVLEEEGDLGHEDMLLGGAHPNQEKLRTMLSNHYFIKHPRVIVTPHIAFYTQEALERILATTIENFTAFNSGSAVNEVG